MVPPLRPSTPLSLPHFLHNGMGRFLSPLRASIEALLRARDPRAQRVDRLIP